MEKNGRHCSSFETNFFQTVEELFHLDVGKSLVHCFLWAHMLLSFTNDLSSDLNFADDNANVNTESIWEEGFLVGYWINYNYEVIISFGVRATQEETGT